MRYKHLIIAILFILITGNVMYSYSQEHTAQRPAGAEAVTAETADTADGSVQPDVPGSADQATADETAALPEQNNSPDEDRESTVSLWSLFRKGGPFMWPILLFAAIACGFIVERFIVFKKANLNPREFIEELNDKISGGELKSVEAFCAANDYILSRIILKGLKLRSLGHDRVEKGLAVAGSVQVAALERGLNVLSSLGNIVPMLGFLGTVSGMISAFSRIASADQVNARLVAGGIEEALLTTAAGLIVAIPTLFFYNYFVHRIEVFIADVEKISSDIVEKMIEETHG